MDLEAELRTRTSIRRLVHAKSCASTQALAEADAGDTAALFWADHQTAGRGRQGRHWDDDDGQDIAVTFKLPGLQLQNPTWLAAAVPLAMLRTLRTILPGLRIKWPNDLLFGGRKLCGILIDTDRSRADTYLVGIGLNVNRQRFPAELSSQATSLRLATGRDFDRKGIVLTMATQLQIVMDELQADMAAELGEEFAQGLGLADQEVVLVQAGEQHTGRLSGVDLSEARLADGRRFTLAHLQQLRAR